MFLLGAVAGGLEFGVSRVAYPDVNLPAPGQAAFAQTRLDGRLALEPDRASALARTRSAQHDADDGRGALHDG